MNSDLITLKRFLELPITSSEGVFDVFCDFQKPVVRGQSPERFLYILGTRSNKVLLVAHADTVWDENYDQTYRGLEQQIIFEHDVIRSGKSECGIGADDRAGCAILWLLKDLGHSILITDGEEGGSLGSSSLMNHEDNADVADEINNQHQFMVQLDRCNGTDFKCYKVGTAEFKRYIRLKTGYIDAGESRSTDIMKLCRSITGVNLSIGYHEEHGPDEYLIIEEWLNTLDLCRRWLSEPELAKFRLPNRN